MAKRDELFRQFGPLLIEAIVDFVLNNLNDLRQEQGMPEITKDDFCEQLLNHLSELEPYDWTGEEP